MYMRVFGKTHQIAYTYCSVGISDLKPLAGTSEDQLRLRTKVAVFKAIIASEASLFHELAGAMFLLRAKRASGTSWLAQFSGIIIYI